MDDPRQKLTKQNQCFEAIYTGLDNIIMPFGWDTSNFPLSIQEQLAKQVNPLFPTTKVLSILGTIKLIFGWLLSAAAIGMGAPFWFDLLGKFINVRNAGQAPEPTFKDQPS